MSHNETVIVDRAAFEDLPLEQRQRIEISQEEADRLRDVIRAEVMQRELHELATLRARIAALEAVSARRAVLESIADAHGFDATDAYEFDFQARTLTKKG